MDLKTLFNSNGNAPDLAVGWGLALLVGNTVLFDTGENGDALIKNAGLLNVDLSRVHSVVISHDHWDHTGGLWDLIELNNALKVYACPGFHLDFKQKVRRSHTVVNESIRVTKVTKDIFTTGEILGKYKGAPLVEQALVVETDRGISILTGCAHPGILKILQYVSDKFSDKRIYSVIGGFHLMGTSLAQIESLVCQFKNMGVQNVGPTHCSGTEAENIFRTQYPDNFWDMKVGAQFVL